MRGFWRVGLRPANLPSRSPHRPVSRARHAILINRRCDESKRSEVLTGATSGSRSLMLRCFDKRPAATDGSAVLHNAVSRGPRQRRRLGLPLSVLLLTGSLSAACTSGFNPYEDQLEAGDEFGYSLNTHCGIEWARIGATWWSTDRLDDGNGNPPPEWGNPSQGGRMHIDSNDRATFSGGPEPLTFVRTDIVDMGDSRLPDNVRFCD